MQPGRRIKRLGGVALALAALLGACGDDDAGGGDETAANAEAGADADAAFPRTVEHGLGSATIEEQPVNVVALGNDADIAAALGVVPVGAHEDLRNPGELSPWLTDFVGDTAAVTPLATTEAPPLEQIAELEPDIILASTWWQIESAYDDLESLGVPVIAFAEGVETDTWQDSTRLLSEALGREAAAEELIADVESSIADAAAQHPEWAGTTFSYSFRTADAYRVLTSPDDPSVQFLNQLGFELAPASSALSYDPAIGGADISLEQTDSLDADVVLVTYQSDDVRHDLEADPLFTRLPAVGEGRYVPVDLDSAYALRLPSPVNILYALEKLVPQLEAAIAG